jgi:hypothetical protein
MLLVVWYGRETSSLTLREERRPRVSDLRVLRRIFRSKRDELTGEWRRLLNEELNYLYCLRNVRVIKSIRMRWAGNMARMGEGRDLYRFSVAKPDGQRPLGRTRRRWEENIKMYIQEVRWGRWMGLLWLRIGTGGWLL